MYDVSCCCLEQPALSCDFDVLLVDDFNLAWWSSSGPFDEMLASQRECVVDRLIVMIVY